MSAPLTAYLFLATAITAEVLGTSLLKSTEGFTRLWPTVGTLTAYAVAFACLAKTVEHLPVGLAYAVWAGLGTTAIVLVGVVFLGEPITAVKVLGIALVVAGVVVLNTGGAH